MMPGQFWKELSKTDTSFTVRSGKQVWGSEISTGLHQITDIDLNYDRVGLSIEAFEASNEVNKVLLEI